MTTTPVEPDPWWRVQLVVGNHAWDITSTDDPDYGPTGSLSFGWELMEQPGIPEESASFGLIAAAPLTTLDKNQPVAIRVWLTDPATDQPDPETADYSFYGRVTDLTATPHQLGLLYSLTATGWFAQLANVSVGAGTWPEELFGERVSRVFAEAGQPLVMPVAPEWLVGWQGVPPRDGDPTSAADLIRTYQAISAVPDDLGYDLDYGLVPHPYATDTGVGNPLSPAVSWAYDPVPVNTDQPPGATLQLVGGVVRVVPVAPDADALVLDSCYVDRGAQWRRDLSGATTAVVTYVPWNTYVPGDPNPPTASLTVTRSNDPDHLPVLTTIETPFLGFHSEGGSGAVVAAQLHLPDADPAAWAGEAYRVHLWRDSSHVARVIPNHADYRMPGDPGRTAGLPYGRRVMITGIPVTNDPSGRGWVAGRPTGARFVLDAKAGRYYLDLQLDTTIPRSDHPDTLTWADLDAGWTWDQLDPAMTWYDLRLC